MNWSGLLTGRHWRRLPKTCPPWCGGGHLCTARHGYPSGEHRSDPIRVARPYGVIVCTRVLRVDGVGWLELRTRVNLSPGEVEAGQQAVLVADEVDQAIQGALFAATGAWVDPEMFPMLTAG